MSAGPSSAPPWLLGQVMRQHLRLVGSDAGAQPAAALRAASAALQADPEERAGRAGLRAPARGFGGVDAHRAPHFGRGFALPMAATTRWRRANSSGEAPAGAHSAPDGTWPLFCASGVSEAGGSSSHEAAGVSGVRVIGHPTRGHRHRGCPSRWTSRLGQQLGHFPWLPDALVPPSQLSQLLLGKYEGTHHERPMTQRASTAHRPRSLCGG